MRALLTTLISARAEQKLTCEGIAEKIGCHRNSVNGWENQRNCPNLDSFIAWAQTLGYEVTLTKAPQ
jgi:DNA-binding XRE family transcriptional regulator